MLKNNVNIKYLKWISRNVHVINLSSKIGIARSIFSKLKIAQFASLNETRYSFVVNDSGCTKMIVAILLLWKMIFVVI